jgi:hypothetical protein
LRAAVSAELPPKEEVYMNATCPKKFPVEIRVLAVGTGVYVNHQRLFRHEAVMLANCLEGKATAAEGAGKKVQSGYDWLPAMWPAEAFRLAALLFGGVCALGEARCRGRTVRSEEAVVTLAGTPEDEDEEEDSDLDGDAAVLVPAHEHGGES